MNPIGDVTVTTKQIVQWKVTAAERIPFINVYTVSAENKEYKVYIGVAQGEFKTRLSKHTKSFGQTRDILKENQIVPL